MKQGIIAGFIAIVLFIGGCLVNRKQAPHQTTIVQDVSKAAIGNNSPVVQAGPNATVNVGVSESTVGEMIALAKPSGLLKPSNEPIPEIIANDGTLADGELAILLGPFAISTPQSSFTVLRLYGKDVVRIDRNKNAIAVSADIWSEDGKIMASIETNRFRINPNRIAYFDTPDPHTLIVTDERKTQVLFIRYLNPTTVKITGVFRSSGEHPVIIDENEMTFGPFVFGRWAALHLTGKHLFSWDATVPPDLPEPGHTNAVQSIHQQNGISTFIYYDKKGRPWLGPQLGGREELISGRIGFRQVD